MLISSVRRFGTSALRRMHYEEGPGKNLPFSVDNKWKFCLSSEYVITGLRRKNRRKVKTKHSTYSYK
ncbi:cytochrome c oxidase subunit 7C mitochondrial [Crotalus adamanteus]|uniref:Cytochrome c oxidase subunit 7C, mitochondrial n=1 Tax=Crotalus adamanteus TaxID=8729 RepID=A0AAW1C3Z7_CROAD